MKKILTLLVVVAVTALPYAARAQCGGAVGSTDYKCTNACPLAKKASTRRATGLEAALTSESVRDAVTATVAANMKKI
jgi:hypothetical protein